MVFTPRERTGFEEALARIRVLFNVSRYALVYSDYVAGCSRYAGGRSTTSSSPVRRGCAAADGMRAQPALAHCSDSSCATAPQAHPRGAVRRQRRLTLRRRRRLRRLRRRRATCMGAGDALREADRRTITVGPRCCAAAWRRRTAFSFRKSGSLGRVAPHHSDLRFKTSIELAINFVDLQFVRRSERKTLLDRLRFVWQHTRTYLCVRTCAHRVRTYVVHLCTHMSHIRARVASTLVRQVRTQVYAVCGHTLRTSPHAPVCTHRTYLCVRYALVCTLRTHARVARILAQHTHWCVTYALVRTLCTYRCVRTCA